MRSTKRNFDKWRDNAITDDDPSTREFSTQFIESSHDKMLELGASARKEMNSKTKWFYIPYTVFLLTVLIISVIVCAFPAWTLLVLVPPIVGVGILTYFATGAVAEGLGRIDFPAGYVSSTIPFKTTTASANVTETVVWNKILSNAISISGLRKPPVQLDPEGYRLWSESYVRECQLMLFKNENFLVDSVKSVLDEQLRAEFDFREKVVSKFEHEGDAGDQEMRVRQLVTKLESNRVVSEISL